MNNKYKKITIALSVILTIFIGVVSINYISKEDNNIEVLALEDKNIDDTKEVKSSSFYIDIKGAVKHPGVYFVEDGSIVQDAINLAGGLNKDAVTKNINLSQKLKSEMVIYIFNKTELKKEVTTAITDTMCTTNIIEIKEPTENITNSQSQEPINKKININTASKEELMTLDGVGASKADSIIIYRSGTKFTKIEDIMNVSGIGEAAFAKIKESITV